MFKKVAEVTFLYNQITGVLKNFFFVKKHPEKTTPTVYQKTEIHLQCGC